MNCHHAPAAFIAIIIAMAVVVFPAHGTDVDTAMQAAKRAAEGVPPAPHIARDAFLQEASVRDISISPDGQWLAFRLETEQRVELRVRKIASGKEWRVMSDSEETEIYWSGDSARLWLPDAQGISVFDLATKTGRRIFQYKESRQQMFWLVDRNAPDFALLREKVPVNGEWLYRYLAVDANGKTRVIYESRKALQSVLLDKNSELRYSSGYAGEQFDTVIWKHATDKKQEMMRCPLPEQCRLVAHSGNSVWALAHNGENLMSLQRFDPISNRWRTLHRDPRGISDAITVLMQPDGKNWFAIAYRPDHIEWHGRTTNADAAFANLEAALPGTNLSISPANDGNLWLVQADKSVWQYDRYFLYEVAANSLQELFAAERHGSLPTSQRVITAPVHWRGKDGMSLHGYVFLPTGVALENAPIIAFLHGGPYGRSSGEADPGVQLMVNRGYIVFKPNFRASTDYGVNYVTAAQGNFGKTGVLDDIITGLDYLIANGIGDAKQQAVAGHSFGGYASLLAVTHYPDRFAFAVPSAAPVNIAWIMKDIAIEGGSAVSADGPPIEILLPGYGMPYGEQAWHERMQRESPLAHAADLHTPVYLWAGAKDDRVALESIVRYVAKANPKFQPALLIDPDSGHSPRQRLNVEALVWLIENAANEHFGGGVTPPSRALQAFLKKNLKKGAVLR